MITAVNKTAIRGKNYDTVIDWTLRYHEPIISIYKLNKTL